MSRVVCVPRTVPERIFSKHCVLRESRLGLTADSATSTHVQSQGRNGLISFGFVWGAVHISTLCEWWKETRMAQWSREEKENLSFVTSVILPDASEFLFAFKI